MKILAIDPSLRESGWALSTDIYGTWKTSQRKDESAGMSLIRIRSKLKEVFESEDFDVVVYERPGGRNTNSIITQSKVIGIIEAFCHDNSIEFRAYSSGEIKKFATGKGNAGKPEMVKTAKEKYGYPGTNDNEADALHLLALANHELK